MPSWALLPFAVSIIRCSALRLQDASLDALLEYRSDDALNSSQLHADFRDESSWGQYDFKDRWDGLGFEDRWKMFREAVDVSAFQDFYDPALDTGPVCQPTLEGPEDSPNLAILSHGFLACPGLFFRVVGPLIEAGFRVMRPTLPGHGRKCTAAPHSNDDVQNEDDIDDDDGDEFGTPSLLSSELQDDISDMPSTAKPYLDFADALGMLAEQFKKEHPNGKVVAAGHSLGGMITAKFAMERPHYVDHVLLINPMFALSWGFIGTAAALGPDSLWSKGSSCEKQRGKSSGGICQFRLRHITAMIDLAKEVLCCHWKMPISLCGSSYLMSYMVPAGMLGGRSTPFTNAVPTTSQCHVSATAADRTRKQFGHIGRFQVISTRWENMVDNDVISDLVDVVRDTQSIFNWGVNSMMNYNLCYWPFGLGHAYLSNRPKEGMTYPSGQTKWWHPYVENAVVKFLLTGKHVDIVSAGDSNDCVTSDSDVAGGSLAVLPAWMHVDSYDIGMDIIGMETSRAEVLFEGDVEKQSEWFGRWHERNLEFIRFDPSTFVIATRKERNENIRDMFLVGAQTIEVDDDKCVAPSLSELDPTEPLYKQIANAKEHVVDYPKVIKFCQQRFAQILCEHFSCT